MSSVRHLRRLCANSYAEINHLRKYAGEIERLCKALITSLRQCTCNGGTKMRDQTITMMVQRTGGNQPSWMLEARKYVLVSNAYGGASQAVDLTDYISLREQPRIRAFDPALASLQESMAEMDAKTLRAVDLNLIDGKFPEAHLMTEEEMAVKKLQDQFNAVIEPLKAALIEQVKFQFGTRSGASMKSLYALMRKVASCNAYTQDTFRKTFARIEEKEGSLVFDEFDELCADIKRQVIERELGPLASHDPEKIKGMATQVTSNGLKLVLHAKWVTPMFEKLVSSIVDVICRQYHNGITGTVLDMKPIYRMIETTLLNPKNFSGGYVNIKWNMQNLIDVQRGQLVCDSMEIMHLTLSQIRAVSVINIVSVENRFADPTDGGWRDCLISFYFVKDPHRHACELQLRHAELSSASELLGGELTFTRGRTARELLGLAAVATPHAGVLAMASMLLEVYPEKISGGDELDRNTKRSFASWLVEDNMSLWEGVAKTKSADGEERVDYFVTALTCFGDSTLARGPLGLQKAFDGALKYQPIQEFFPPGSVLDLGRFPNSTDDWVHAIVETFGSMIELVTLQGAYKISSAGISKLIRGCSNLLELKLSTCKQISDQHLDELGKHCPHLRMLDLSRCDPTPKHKGSGGVTTAGLLALLEGCPDIEMLCLEWCAKIDSHGLEQLSILKSLKWLSVSNCCRAVTDAFLEAVAKGCPRLEYLDLSYCRKVTISGVRALATVCQRLRTLNLAECYRNMDDKCVACLVQNCSTLLHLDMSYCAKISDKSLVEISNYSPQLQTLNVECCYEVSDPGIQAIAERCQKLKVLRINEEQVSQATLLRFNPACQIKATTSTRLVPRAFPAPSPTRPKHARNIGTPRVRKLHLTKEMPVVHRITPTKP